MTPTLRAIRSRLPDALAENLEADRVGRFYAPFSLAIGAGLAQRAFETLLDAPVPG